MSLINDALKRASQSMKKRPAGGENEGVQMQPAETGESGGGKSKLLILLAVLLLGGGGYYGWTWWKGRSKPAQTAAATASKPGGTNKAAAATAPAASTNQGAVAAAIQKPLEKAKELAQKITDRAQEVTGLTPAAPVEKKVTFPELKLQGIFYRLSRPSAMINGKPVYPGETIEGVKVVGITRQAVLVELEGQTNTLTLR